LRTYALGLAHFLEWLAARAVRLDRVAREDVAGYVAEFARNEVDGVTIGRAPATVNHRVSALVSFFAWLIERDGVVGRGPWVGRMSPVPSGSAAWRAGTGCLVVRRRGAVDAVSCVAVCQTGCRLGRSWQRSPR
jgi:hypothetical protein